MNPDNDRVLAERFGEPADNQIAHSLYTLPACACEQIAGLPGKES